MVKWALIERLISMVMQVWLWLQWLVGICVKPMTLMPKSMQAVALICLSATTFALMNTFIRMLSGQLPTIEIVAFRNLFGLFVLLPWAFSFGLRQAVSTSYWPFFAWRTCIGLTGMFGMFLSVALLPAAEAVALNFVMPMFAVLGAYLFLGEKVGPRRWVATAVGFLGMLIIVQPGSDLFKWEAAVPILAAAAMAAAILSVKHLTSLGENPVRAVFIFAVLATPISFAITAFVWVTPSWSQLFIMFMVGATGSLAHVCFTAAFKRADASSLMVFDYLRLPFVAFFAFFLLGEIPSVWIWPGAAVMAAAAGYIAHREAVRAREGA